MMPGQDQCPLRHSQMHMNKPIPHTSRKAPHVHTRAHARTHTQFNKELEHAFEWK